MNTTTTTKDELLEYVARLAPNNDIAQKMVSCYADLLLLEGSAIELNQSITNNIPVSTYDDNEDERQDLAGCEYADFEQECEYQLEAQAEIY